MDRSADLALIFRNAPYRGRAPRADLDLALAAAALDQTVEIYLLGPALLQLAKQLKPDAAGLPAGYRAWAALPELGDVKLFAEQCDLDRCADAGIELFLPVRGLPSAELSGRWRLCRHAVVV